MMVLRHCVHVIPPTGKLKRLVQWEEEHKKAREVEDKSRESSSENREQAAYPCVIIER